MLDTPFNQLILSINAQGMLILVKVALVVGFFIYFVFAAVAVAQIKRMFETINTGGEALFEVVGWAHLGLSLLALVWAIVVI
jgi:hypothetical protein